MRLGVVILAAGASSRMGRPKMLLPWGATSVLGHLIAQWRGLPAEQVAVVCAPAGQAIHLELDRLGFPQQDRIINPTPELGMFSSVRCAASWNRWNSTLSHWAIVLGDQPHLKRETLGALIDFARTQPDKICQPSWHGRPRHPVLLPEPVFRALGNSAEQHLKQFLRAVAQPVALCEMDDPGLDFDLDQPSDYERAVHLFTKGKIALEPDAAKVDGLSKRVE
jgi:molybdenum cofactor cytidylyltransferase